VVSTGAPFLPWRPIPTYSSSYHSVLTTDTFTFGLHGWEKTLQLSEIVRVSIRYYDPFKLYPWGGNITDSNGRIIFMPIARWALLNYDNNIFDYRKMLIDLLQLLPATAVVEDGVSTFLNTGNFK
jgi:hypothetical protein